MPLRAARSTPFVARSGDRCRHLTRGKTSRGHGTAKLASVAAAKDDDAGWNARHCANHECSFIQTKRQNTSRHSWTLVGRGARSLVLRPCHRLDHEGQQTRQLPERAFSCGDSRSRGCRAGSLDVSGQKPEPLIVRLTWRGHLVLIAGVAVLFAGTAAAHNQRTDIRQGGVVVAWVNGGGPMPHSWLYCDNETLAYEGQDGRLYVDGRLNVHHTHDTLGWAVRGTNGWKVWANPKLAGRAVLVGSVTRQSSSRWNIVRSARQPRYAQWTRIKPRLVAQAVGRDGDAAGASFLLQFGTCR
jgi:hypothetical protein